MHALRRFIQEQLDARGWDGADLVRKSGISKQRVYPMLSDDRDRIDRMPHDATIAGLARAFGVDENLVRVKVVQAMGVDLEAASVVLEMTTASNEELLHELGRRLGVADQGTGDSDDDGAPMTPRPPTPLRPVGGVEHTSDEADQDVAAYTPRQRRRADEQEHTEG